MARCFTVYWKNALWEKKRQTDDGKEFVHTAGNDFHQKGIRSGDLLYVVTVLDGRLYLAGKIEVMRIVSGGEAEQYLQGPLYKASDHVLAREDDIIPFDFYRAVPTALVKQLRFLRTDKPSVPLRFGDRDRLDQQTLRKTRELTPESAALLDDLIGARVVQEA